jgi:hypothetical protein
MSMIFLGGSREIFELPEPAIARIDAIVAADWAAYHVPSPEGAEGYWVDAAKDREMARRADFGMMVWDGASPGTAVNVLRLAIANKPCVIYDLARGSMATTYNVEDWYAMLRHAGPDIRRQAEARMTADERLALPG